MSLSEKLRQLRYENRLTATYVSHQLGIAKSTLSNYEKGIRIPKAEMLGRFALFYKTSLDYLFDVEKVTRDNITYLRYITENITVPIFGIISDAIQLGLRESCIGYTDLGSEYAGKGEHFALCVTGDSMSSSRICDGDMVIVRKQSSIENGKIAVVLADGENATIKRFFRTGSTVTLMPSSVNPIHKPLIYDVHRTNVAVLGQVVEVKIKL